MRALRRKEPKCAATIRGTVHAAGEGSVPLHPIRDWLGHANISQTSTYLGDRLAGAALDVFEDEPLPASSRLRALPNCWLAPHNANSSVAAAERVHERTVRALLDVLRAEELEDGDLSGSPETCVALVISTPPASRRQPSRRVAATCHAAASRAAPAGAPPRGNDSV